MNHSFVPDGGLRLSLDETFQARRTSLKKSIRAKYAAELSKAGLLGKLAIHHRIRRELNREWKKVTPSIHALF
jgi:hypothetical protein